MATESSIHRWQVETHQAYSTKYSTQGCVRRPYNYDGAAQRSEEPPQSWERSRKTRQHKLVEGWIKLDKLRRDGIFCHQILLFKTHISGKVGFWDLDIHQRWHHANAELRHARQAQTGRTRNRSIWKVILTLCAELAWIGEKELR